MSGKRQHIIPQFLLKGFATQKKKTFSSWVYRKDRTQFRANVSKIGVSKRFYENSDGVSADDLMTLNESDLSLFVYELRQLNRETIVDDDRVFKLVSQSFFRTRFIRLSISKTLYKSCTNLSTVLSSPQIVKKIFFSNLDKYIQYMDNNWEEVANEYQIPQELRDELLNTFKAGFLSVSPQKLDIFSKFAVKKIQKTAEASEINAKRAHIQSIISDYEKDYECTSFGDFIWHIALYDSLILGDSICFFFSNSKKIFRSNFDHNEDISHIVLPLSTTHCLIGKRSMSEEDLSSETIYLGSARCSSNFFIAEKQTDTLINLKRHIGQHSDLISGKLISEMIEDVIAERSL